MRNKTRRFGALSPRGGRRLKRLCGLCDKGATGRAVARGKYDGDSAQRHGKSTTESDQSETAKETQAD